MQSYVSLGHREAAVAIEAIRAELDRRGKAAVIAVADPHGELISLVRARRGAPRLDRDRHQQGLDRRPRAEADARDRAGGPRRGDGL